MSQTKSNLSPPNGGHVTHSDSAILVRAVLVVLLTLTFLGALRWAMNVTQANARQMSRSMMRLKTHIEGKKPDVNRFQNAPGPVIEPEDNLRHGLPGNGTTRTTSEVRKARRADDG